MAGITLAQAESKLALWLAAEEKIAANQSYTIDGRTLARADLADVRTSIDYWNNQVKRLAAAASGRRRTRYVVPG